MTVIHVDFGGGSPPPASPFKPELIERIRETAIRDGAASARELAMTAHAAIDRALAEFERLNPAERQAAARDSLETVHACADDQSHSIWITELARHAWRARIMMAKV